MRKLTWIIVPALILAVLWFSAQRGEGVEASGPSNTMQLELPELGTEKYSPGVVRIPEPEKVRRLTLHIPLTRVHQAFPKINTIGTGLALTMRARQDEVLCDIDLSRYQGRFYALNSADNTVELKVVPRLGVDPLYAQWVIAPPKEPQSWQTHDRPAGRDASPAGAELSKEGLIVLEELEDGRLVRLDRGVTMAQRVFLRANFKRREESVSLRVHWAGPEGAERTFSVGNWAGSAKGGKDKEQSLPTLEGDIELALGQNRLDVEVMHGYTVLSRSTYRIYRRTPSNPAVVAGEKWAVIIGISDYQADGLNLRYANHDAEKVRDFLVEKGRFRSDRVRLLTDQRATYSEIRTALFNFLAAAQPDDMVLIFLAGHGVQDSVNPDNFFFLTHDSDIKNLGGTAVPMWDLGNVMDYTIRSQRIMVFADTCHSGAAQGRGGVNAGGSLNFFNKYLEVLAKKKGRLVLTASQAHENSLEAEKFGQGVFTHALLLGLSGSADDNPADGIVTAGELVDYIQEKVPEDTKGDQHPSFSQQGFDMNQPLSYVGSAKALKH